jgi:hypothetical protein
MSYTYPGRRNLKYAKMRIFRSFQPPKMGPKIDKKMIWLTQRNPFRAYHILVFFRDFRGSQRMPDFVEICHFLAIFMHFQCLKIKIKKSLRIYLFFPSGENIL